jgi:transcriptional regulator with XRE-family HTH domain
MTETLKSMEPLELKIKLMRLNITQAALAREIGVSQPAVARVIKGHSASERIRKAIAHRIGMDVEAIWPDCNYRKPGRPISTLPAVTINS